MTLKRDDHVVINPWDTLGFVNYVDGDTANVQYQDKNGTIRTVWVHVDRLESVNKPSDES